MLNKVKQKILSLFQKSSPFCAVGVALHPDSMDIVALSKSGDGFKVALFTKVVCELTDWQQSLTNVIKEYQLDNAECQFVLAGAQYQVLQVDKPQVPDEELGEALKWAVKDFVPSSDELAMDYFDVPVQQGGVNKINLVTSKRTDIAAVVEGIEKLQLKGITIEELSICSLMPNVPDAKLLLTQQPGEDLRILVVKDGAMFFSRTVAGYAQMTQMNNPMALASAADALSLEIQRSMDYFEASLRQAPVSQILLGLPAEYNEQIMQGVQLNFDIDIKAFDLNLENLAEENQPDSIYYPALGAAMEVAQGSVQ